MSIATYVHLDEKKVVKCNTDQAANHPIIKEWRLGEWKKSAWVTDSVLAFSCSSLSTSMMLAQALEIIAATEPITA